MSPLIRRRRVLQAALPAIAAWAPAVRAHEYHAPYFTLVHPWTRATAPGTSTAIISMVFQDVSESDRLVGADTPVADGAERGGDGGPALDIAIPAGMTTELRESGVHLRLVGLRMPLHLAREYPINLRFEKSGPLKASFLVDFLPLV